MSNYSEICTAFGQYTIVTNYEKNPLWAVQKATMVPGRVSIAPGDDLLVLE
jgi:hypothetical protein